MKKVKVFLKKLFAVTFVAVMFLVTSGFTYTPGKPLYAPYVEITGEGENHSNLSVGDGMFLARNDWYNGGARQVDGIWGATAPYNTDGYVTFPVALAQSGFSNATKAKITIKYYDPKNAGGNVYMGFRVLYCNSSGSVVATGDKLQELYCRNWGTGKWQEQVVELDDIKLSGNTPLSTFANRDVVIALKPQFTKVQSAPVDKAGNPVCDPYYGVLINSVKIEPESADTNTFQLESFENVKPVTWCADGTGSGITWENGSAKTDTALLTVTDSESVENIGKMAAVENATNANTEAHFKIDPVKYENVSNFKVKITYYDAPDSTGKKTRFQLKSLNTAMSEVPVFNDVYGSNSGKWVTQEFQLDDRNLSSAAVDAINGWRHIPSNFFIWTPDNYVLDNGTPGDTSDDIYGMLISKVEVSPVTEYTFTNLKFTNGQNDALNSLNAGDSFNTSLTVSRVGGKKPSDVTLIVTLYDKSTNKLERISTQTKSMNENDVQTFNACFVNPTDIEGKVVKIMIWDSLNSLQTIANALEVE